jgi:hypothetical protein
MHVALAILADESKLKNVSFRVHTLEVIINALYYNPLIAFSVLEQHNATAAFFGLWFKNLDVFSRVHDKKLCIVSISNILEMPVDSLPPSLQPGWLQLFEGLLKVYETYGAALEERLHEERMQNGEAEDSDNEEVEEEEGATHYPAPADPDDECPDENDEYLEYLENKAEGHDEESDDDDWSLDVTMDEDIYFVTVLDKIDGYNRFEDLMNNLSARPDVHAHLNSSLTIEKKTAMEQLIIKSRELRAGKMK